MQLFDLEWHQESQLAHTQLDFFYGETARQTSFGVRGHHILDTLSLNLR
jgi:hypothetical protein